MKKASGNPGSKPSAIDSDSFVDELNESQHLRERLRIIVEELKATVGLLEQNLAEARSSVQSPRKAKERSVGKNNESIIADELENREASHVSNRDGGVSSPRPVGKKGARR